MCLMVAHDAAIAGGFEEGRERLAVALLGCFGGEKAQGCGLFCCSSREEQEGKGLAPWGVGNCGALLLCLLLWWRRRSTEQGEQRLEKRGRCAAASGGPEKEKRVF
jgi:hypothetical protein